MDLLIAVTVISGLYAAALYVNKLMNKIDEHDDILNSDE